MNLDIFTCLANNSAPYAQRLYENLTKLSSRKHTLRFWAMVAHQDIEHIGYPPYWSIINVDTQRLIPRVSKPSVNHAKLLNQIVHHIPEDSHVTIITDCDMFVFPHNWDDFIYRKTRELDCIGTAKHDGSLRMFFIAFPSFVYQTIEPDFMPGIDKTFDSVWTYTKDGCRVVADTGWKLEDLLIENEKSYEKMELIGNKYLYHDQLFCSHLGGSHKKDFKSQEVKRWYAECKTLIYK